MLADLFFLLAVAYSMSMDSIVAIEEDVTLEDLQVLLIT